MQITVGLGGEAAGLKAEPITAAVLKGLLSGFLDQDFNYVNAPFIARERGISVTETRSRETTDYINTLTLSVRTPSGTHEVAGAVIGNRALRLIRIDGYRVEAVPEGYFLMLHNRDVPGVVGAVGTMLGQAGINIAGLELGRDRAGGMALSLVEVDGPVPAEVLERLKTHPGHYLGRAAQALNVVRTGFSDAADARRRRAASPRTDDDAMKTVAVVGTQWGDEGKGKIVDMLAADADVVVRFQGGNNAAHTLVVDGEKFILRLVPAGALHPGKVCVIGNGTVVDPIALVEEIAALQARAAASPTTRCSSSVTTRTW